MRYEHARKHVSFDAATSALVAMEANWPDGSSTGWHEHARSQLLYAIAGVMVVRSEAGSWVVPPNRALWLTAGVAHEVRMSGDVQMRTVYIDEQAIPALPEKVCVIRVSALLRELIVAAIALPWAGSLGRREALLTELLALELQVSDELPLHLPMPTDERARSICEFLVQHPENTFTAVEWAETLGVSSKTIHRLFARETGMSFAQWREQARLLHALRRIACGERIIDIAYDCGYSSPNAFTAMFRRHFGVPPSGFYQSGVAGRAAAARP